MASQRDVKNKIASVRNIQKITRAMEMVAAARLRRAEQRITALRPYAEAIGRMTRQAAQAAGAESARVPLLREHDTETRAGLLLVTGDRGLAGGFNSQIIRAGLRLSGELGDEGLQSTWYATGRRGVSSLAFRGHDLAGSYTGFADRPAYADARTIADEIIRAYVDGHVDRVEMVFNSYVSPLTQTVTHQRLLPLSHQDIGADDLEISIYRALVESAAGFFGAQMTAMRSASENAGEIITDYTLQMNRARQAEITQEIMEVVAGAEGLS
jgi:F-type H+-transporting ATPase subunit gamma